MERDVCLVDVETTGFSPKDDRIVSAAFARVNLNKMATDLAKHEKSTIAEVLTTVVNPGRKIPAAAVKVHGISNRAVKGKPSFADEAKELRDYIGNLPIVAHNASFDKNFLNAEFKRAGVKSLSRNRSFCTMLRFQDDCNNGRRSGSNLEDACQKLFGKGRISSRHDALEDIKLTGLLAAYFYAKDNGINFEAMAKEKDDGGVGSMGEFTFWFIVAVMLGIWLLS